jgi:iron complex transport system substrate-binding protein
VFPELNGAALARDRIVDPAEVARRDPEVILASWCGKKVRKSVIRNRIGWTDVTAVATNRFFEVKSTYILQPGPASLTEGVRQIHALFARIHGMDIDPSLAPDEALDNEQGNRPA